MDLGKVVRTIVVPETRPVVQPEREDDAPIPAPNWPIRMPIKTPVPAEAD